MICGNLRPSDAKGPATDSSPHPCVLQIDKATHVVFSGTKLDGNGAPVVVGTMNASGEVILTAPVDESGSRKRKRGKEEKREEGEENDEGDEEVAEDPFPFEVDDDDHWCEYALRAAVSSRFSPALFRACIASPTPASQAVSDPVPVHCQAGMLRAEWRASPDGDAPLPHSESPLEAYEDVAPILDVLAKGLGKTRESLQIYDPYFCNGSVRKNLASLGFTQVSGLEVTLWPSNTMVNNFGHCLAGCSWP